MSEIITATNGVAVPDDWPTGKYGAILADPPWRFRTWSEKNQSRAASRHYSLMTLPEICTLPVAELAAPDCVLFLWVTRPMLREAFTVAEAWGFEFKTVAFTWTKTTKHGKEHMGLGYWSRANPEQCWLFTRGKPKRLPTGRSVREWITSPAREHSRKPDEVHERIERLVAGPYVELFARSPWPHWDVWGDEANRFTPVEGSL